MRGLVFRIRTLSWTNFAGIQIARIFPALFSIALSGCAASLERNSAPPPLAVNLSALKTCESALVEAPLAKAKPGDVADVAFMKADAATITANANIRSGRKCVGDVRRRYQGKKQP